MIPLGPAIFTASSSKDMIHCRMHCKEGINVKEIRSQPIRTAKTPCKKSCDFVAVFIGFKSLWLHLNSIPMLKKTLGENDN